MEDKKFEAAFKEWQTPKYKNAFLILASATVFCTLFFGLFIGFGKDIEEIKI